MLETDRQPKKVLLVEDSPRVSLAIGMSLKALGYEVIDAPDAGTAIEAASQHSPDVAVLDVHLPGIDGFGLAERLKESAALAVVPIIFITASKQEQLRERAREAGAVCFIEKPFGVSDLADAINRAFSSVSAIGSSV